MDKTTEPLTSTEKKPYSDSDSDSDSGPEGSLKPLLQEARRDVRRLELEKLNFLHALRRLLNSVGLVLSRGWAPRDTEGLVRGMLAALDGDDVPPSAIEEFAARLAGHLEVRGAELSAPPGAGAFAGPAFTRYLSDAASLKGARYAEDAAKLSELVAGDAPLAVFAPVLAGFLLRMAQDSRTERQEISIRLSAIIRSLLNIERQFRDFLDKSLTIFGTGGRDFSQTLTAHLQRLQGAASAFCHDDPERLFGIISEEVTLLSDVIQRKSEEDDRLIELMRTERKSLKVNLADVTRDYNSFVEHSNQLLKELEVIKAVALRDALTGVYNRRAYNEQALLTLVNYKAGKLQGFSHIIFDIDFFRNVNNHHGHQAGDSILEELAKVLVSTLRSDDFIFRYGGDEFVVLLPNAGLEAGAKVAEKIRLAVGEHPFPISKSSKETINITISVGVAAARPGDTPESILARADSALYASKAGGRNRVTSEESRPLSG
jgi:diguanylate cyclase (GGDEF)-like protein